MGSRWLRPYIPTIRVTAESAKHDKIDVEYGNWELRGSDRTSFEIFFATLTMLPSENALDVPGLAVEAAESWFTRQSIPNSFRPVLTVRQGGRGRGSRPGRPLITGKLKTRTGRRGEQTERFVSDIVVLRLDAKLNPTRFVQYQPRREWVSMRTLPADQWTLPPPQLVSGEAILSDLDDEYSLDGADNVLMGRSAVTYARDDAWLIHVERYWDAIFSHIDGLIRQAAGNAGLGVERPTMLNFKGLETYWEFRMEDPVAWVREVEPALTSLGLSSDARTYPYPEGLAVESTSGNSRSLTIRIRPGTMLRVYAKTNRRVRMEIYHNFKENPSVLGGRRTSEDHQQFFTWLKTASASAAEDMNFVLEYLERVTVRHGDQASITQLVSAITQALGDDVKATDFLMLLASNASVTVTVGSGLRTSVRTLRSRGILEPVRPNGSVYILTSRFTEAGRILRRISSGRA